MGADWAAGIDIKVDSSSLKTGIGGVELVGFGGKITLTNTLQSRLMLAYETQLPKLRSSLFTTIS
jgi:vacuolar-type H+-ATPase subunit E/Vma4